MSETTTVNDLVTKHAEERREKGSSGEHTPPPTTEKEKPGDNNTPPPIDPDLKAELERLKKENEELKKPREQPKAKTGEEVKKEKALYEANLIQFSTANDEMKPEDFVQLETLRATPDQDLVFQRFSAEHKEDHPEADDEEIRTAFEQEYKIKDTNEKARDRGSRRIEKEATEMRSPVVQKYEKVKGRFDQESAIRAEYPVFAGKMEELATGSVPEKMEVFKGKEGEEEVAVDFPLTEEQKKDLKEKVSKRLQSPKNYALYKEGKVEEIQAKAKAIAENIIWTEYRQPALEELAKTFSERGKKKGSNVGAQNPFPMRQQAPSGANRASTADKEQQVLDSLNGKKS